MDMRLRLKLILLLSGALLLAGCGVEQPLESEYASNNAAAAVDRPPPQVVNKPNSVSF